jgi:hypothetical protein
MSNQNNTPPPEGELKFQMQAMTQMMERMNFVMGGTYVTDLIGWINVVTRMVQAPKM